MVEQREKVSRQVKRALVYEAWNKCANPGCSNYRTVTCTTFREWAVYETNDQERNMIVTCSSCHDAVHLPPVGKGLFGSSLWGVVRRGPALTASRPTAAPRRPAPWRQAEAPLVPRRLRPALG
jgi:hypothetical protein